MSTVRDDSEFRDHKTPKELDMLTCVVEFRMIVFRPFKGEVMLARIRSSTPAGINLRTDFFDDIFIPYEELPQGAE